MLIDLFVKEYKAEMKSYVPFKALMFFCCLSVAVCIASIGIKFNFLSFDENAAANWWVWVAVISGVIAFILVIVIYLLTRNTEISQTNLKHKRKEIKTFLKKRGLEGMNVEQMQELIKCIEDRANELQFFNPMYSKIKGLFAVCIIPIAGYTVNSIAQGLDTYKLVVGSLWLIFLLTVLFVVVHAVLKLVEEVLNKQMRQYYAIASDLRIYCALKSR